MMFFFFNQLMRKKKGQRGYVWEREFVRVKANER